ncbi:RNA polymerase sigma factor [Marinisporobacter balticus]|uniref:RNA polymerase sigma-70 factor (ECF subfamily) n=1 Tax=Marinisporobacter balticus TaxID=2018667 RepID=A0A4R2KCH8_9FIRM|nr:RNA polymerase sigma factor [Marinisporobacter balticus]TCO67889.1 RNA polymerase sigma-70 factor (ECF subfamily) [Marinisporobacter balticus]
MQDKAQQIELSKQLEFHIQTNYEKLYSLIYRMTENHQDTEDVLQNTFIKAYSNIDNFKKKSKLSTWVYRIAINEGCRYLKSWNKLPLIAITEEQGVSEETFFKGLEYEPSIDDELIVEDMREKCIHGFLKCIPKKMRICFLLKSCLQLKNKDIAEVLEISEDNVKVTLHRARQKLKDMFEMRCSLIDPQKPCKCYLWIKFMRDHNLPLPSGHDQFKNDDLLKRHFKNMSVLRKIDYLYHAEGKMSKIEFISKLKNLSEIL